MSQLRIAYLVLAIIGAVVPMYFFVDWFQTYGFSLVGIVEAWTVNQAARGLMWDLTIAALVLTLWAIAEATARKDYLPLIAIPATFCIGVSCGLPLYLFLRSRPLD